MGKDISAIPDHLTVNGDILEGLKLDDIRAALSGEVGANATINGTILDKVRASLSAEARTALDGTLLDKINATLGLSASIKELAPILLTLLWTEIPIVKLRLPLDYTFGFSLFGYEFFSVRLRGESKAVTANNPKGASGGTDV